MREFIPAPWRRRVYAMYATVGVAIGATQVGFVAAEAGFPVWLKVTLSVYAFVGGSIGFVAATNTGAAADPGDRNEPVRDIDGNDLEG